MLPNVQTGWMLLKTAIAKEFELARLRKFTSEKTTQRSEVLPTGAENCETMLFNSGDPNTCYQEYLKLFEASTKLSQSTLMDGFFGVSRIMFGRRVGEYDHGDDEDPRIHALNPYRSAGYHRDRELEGFICKKLGKERNPNFTYFPIRSFACLDIQTFIDQYLKKYKDQITIIPIPDSPLFFLEIKTDAASTEQIKVTLQAAGFTATMWDIAISCSTDLEPLDAASISSEISLAKYPTNVSELKRSSLIEKLNLIANSKNTVRLMALSLRKMIMGLPDDFSSEQIESIVKRLSYFLDKAVNFDCQNYSKFAFDLYGIVHEISLLLLEAIKSGHPVVAYEEFEKAISTNVISEFGLPKNTSESCGCETIAAASVGGAHAFSIALRLAKKMQLSTPENKGGSEITKREPRICVIPPLYYEFANLLGGENFADKDEPADIYAISIGPIISKHPKGINFGTDLNKFIRNHILRGKRNSDGSLVKPVTIVVDATSALHKNLKIAKDIQPLIENGSITIIVAESHQKFGLIHTDQAQYGEVYGVCSKKSFSADVIAEFKQQAKKDLESSVDMQAGSFIEAKCGYTLERIKRWHFKRGAVLQRFLPELKLAGPNKVAEPSIDSMTNTDELYFFLDNLANTIYTMLNRDSFGHYETTRTVIQSLGTRISAGASDLTDLLIQISQEYAYNFFSPRQMMALLQRYLLTAPEHKNESENIIFAGMLMAISFLQTSKSLKLDDLDNYVFLRCIQEVLPNLANIKGRSCYESLTRYSHEFSQKIPKEKFEIFSKLLAEKQEAIASMSLEKIVKSGVNLAIASLNSHYDFSDSPIIREAIFYLRESALLNDSILQIFAQKDRHSVSLAKAVIDLYENYALQKEILEVFSKNEYEILNDKVLNLLSKRDINARTFSTIINNLYLKKMLTKEAVDILTKDDPKTEKMKELLSKLPEFKFDNLMPHDLFPVAINYLLHLKSEEQIIKCFEKTPKADFCKYLINNLPELSKIFSERSLVAIISILENHIVNEVNEVNENSIRDEGLCLMGMIPQTRLKELLVRHCTLQKIPELITYTRDALSRLKMQNAENIDDTLRLMDEMVKEGELLPPAKKKFTLGGAGFFGGRIFGKKTDVVPILPIKLMQQPHYVQDLIG